MEQSLSGNLYILHREIIRRGVCECVGGCARTKALKMFAGSVL